MIGWYMGGGGVAYAYKGEMGFLGKFQRLG